MNTRLIIVMCIGPIFTGHQPCVAMALEGPCAQLAQALGLHRDSHGLKMYPVVREERQRVFWTQCSQHPGRKAWPGRPAC
jgi:hypothetical protein